MIQQLLKILQIIGFISAVSNTNANHVTVINFAFASISYVLDMSQATTRLALRILILIPKSRVRFQIFSPPPGFDLRSPDTIPMCHRATVCAIEYVWLYVVVF